MPNPLMPPRVSPARGPGRPTLLALATGAGLLAALSAYFGLARQTQGAGALGVQSVAVVVAACDLPARKPLTTALLRVQRLPTVQVPAGTVGTPEELAGQVTTAAITAGEPVTREKVAPRSASLGMAWTVAPGRRAVSVALDAGSGVAGFLEPGDHVDVLATLETGNEPAVTRTILQNARLLAIGSRTGAAPVGGTDTEKVASSATLEATPPEAQALAQAASHGKIQLALRGLGDDGQAAIAGLKSQATTPDMDRSSGATGGHRTISPKPSVLGAERRISPRAVRPPRVVPPPALPQIRVIRGTETTTVTVGE